jgi:hypothetical protein
MKHFYLMTLAGIMSLSIIYAQEYLTTDFEDLNLDTDAYWNGSDESGGFNSGSFFFPNSYDPTFGSWSGWSYSNLKNDTTPGFENQYSAITAGGQDTAGLGNANYGIAWVQNDFSTGLQIPISLRISDNKPYNVKGFYVTNSTYAALSMRDGDLFAKKFGGETGDDPDYFILHIWGMHEGNVTDTIDFYLADYRFSDNEQDYIVDSWEWIELSSLGDVDSLMFMMSSSDAGMFGINTPTYFCVDDIRVLISAASVGESFAENNLKIYPNPSQGFFKVDIDNGTGAEVIISDMLGNRVYVNREYVSNLYIDLSNMAPGSYFVRVLDGLDSKSSIIIKY